MSIRKSIISTILVATVMVITMAAMSKAQAETLRPTVDNFILFFDHSGSMALVSPAWSGLKIKMAKELAVRMTAVIPELTYTSGVNTFAPFGTQLAPTRFNKATVITAVKSIDGGYDPSGRSTPMGFGLDKIDPVLAKMTGTIALIIFSDGNSNQGIDPVAEARALYVKYPGRLCIHIVSYADKAHGKEVVAQIRALNSCSVAGDPAALGSDVALKKFVRNIFYSTM